MSLKKAFISDAGEDSALHCHVSGVMGDRAVIEYKILYSEDGIEKGFHQ